MEGDAAGPHFLKGPQSATPCNANLCLLSALGGPLFHPRAYPGFKLPGIDTAS